MPNVVVPRQLFSGLLDDASLFPPRNASVATAVAGHITWQNSHQRDLVGPLLCPVSGVEELCVALPSNAHLRLALVVDGDLDAFSAALDVLGENSRVTLIGVEAVHARLREQAVNLGEWVTELPGVTGALEVPRVDFEDSLALVAYGPWHIAKYRTGGVFAEAYPSEGELATFLLACAANDLAFKLTAGLHHALRNHDPRTDFQQHGVLNVLLATDAALREEPADAIVSLLAQRDPEVLISKLKHWDVEHCALVRETFTSFGCCEPVDPIDDLKKLGLLEDWP